MTISNTTHKSFSDAIEHGDLDAVRSMLTQHPALASHPDWVPPPIHCAVLWNQPAAAEILLDFGADIEARDPERQTRPLAYAIVYCRPEMIRLLVSRGAQTRFDADEDESLLALARRGTAGAFEEYEDLPRQAEYVAMVDLLEELGID